jgi:hypothetical protein
MWAGGFAEAAEAADARAARHPGGRDPGTFEARRRECQAAAKAKAMARSEEVLLHRGMRLHLGDAACLGKGGLAAGLPSPPIPLNGVSPTLLAAWPPQPITKYIPAPSGSRSSLPKSAPDRSDGGIYGGGGMRARTSPSRSPRRPAGRPTSVLDGHRPSNSTATGPAIHGHRPSNLAATGPAIPRPQALPL